LVNDTVADKVGDISLLQELLRMDQFHHLLLVVFPG
jgi:hypothetical protein